MDTDWQRAFTRILSRLILACGLTALASAQTPGPKQEPATQPNLAAPAQPVTPSQTTPSHLAGVEADKVVRWTLKDAILAALEKKLDLSDAQFRQQVIQIITGVQEAYWNLAFAIRSEEIQRDALKLAEKQLENNREQVKVGTLAQFDVINAAAQVENVRQQVFQAMQTVAQDADALKTLTADGPADDLWTANIVPVESFELKPLMLPLPDALNLALANRPEVRQFALQKEMNELDVKFFRNQTRPQVDLTVS
jgi:outer membrane protein TolC